MTEIMTEIQRLRSQGFLVTASRSISKQYYEDCCKYHIPCVRVFPTKHGNFECRIHLFKGDTFTEDGQKQLQTVLEAGLPPNSHRHAGVGTKNAYGLIAPEKLNLVLKNVLGLIADEQVMRPHRFIRHRKSSATPKPSLMSNKGF